MLVHRLRRWPNIEPTHGQCPVFAGSMTSIYWFSDAQPPTVLWPKRAFIVLSLSMLTIN